MSRRLALTTLLVDDYDRAIAWFTGALGFHLQQDIDQGGGKRWVVVSPATDGAAGLLLARASSDVQAARIGDQTGGRVGFFLETDDFARDHAAMLAAGVEFLEAPRREPYATVAVFRDLYGNTWDLLELA
ncbi:extradiol dioxygenase [Stenotrophomonas sp. Betaine-02u-21]|uniref:VOC family protein n=1 Tax=unclassified Stenotrophomonas TaxID=196198 RepID=UPI000C32679B|nr:MULTISPECIES: VOC family protein [unclassified Stenotrophomonas]PKH75837.1 extradiol dioxygenase [Stenotrophomonas sp. Betaine-02u-21]PKH75965.1 extradiol dioxygenase [Stenotrophomonas sp. Betaine-02u-23]PKH97761.1 extradiol dioxygenase [Stenotrophomonas sp. Bg11-02]